MSCMSFVQELKGRPNMLTGNCADLGDRRRHSTSSLSLDIDDRLLKDIELRDTWPRNMALADIVKLTEGRWTFIPLAIFVLSVVGFSTYELVRWSARVPGFRGPPGKPIVGNLWQIRQNDAPEQYRQWAKKYGPVYQIQLGNIPVLVVNSAAAAKAIFNQHSHATSSRPEFYTFHKVREHCTLKFPLC